MHSILDIQQVKFPEFPSPESSLFVYEGGKAVPFSIQRIFSIKATEKNVRGFHAHKECAQLLIVLQGECKVTCDDGETRKDIMLNDPAAGLLLPPTIWAEQEYQANTILMVLTDKPYAESDYIRNYADFLTFRKQV